MPARQRRRRCGSADEPALRRTGGELMDNDKAPVSAEDRGMLFTAAVTEPLRFGARTSEIENPEIPLDVVTAVDPGEETAIPAQSRRGQARRSRQQPLRQFLRITCRIEPEFIPLLALLDSDDAAVFGAGGVEDRARGEEDRRGLNLRPGAGRRTRHTRGEKIVAQRRRRSGAAGQSQGKEERRRP